MSDAVCRAPVVGSLYDSLRSSSGVCLLSLIDALSLVSASFQLTPFSSAAALRQGAGYRPSSEKQIAMIAQKVIDTKHAQ